ncbi:FtsX-like permease family protein [Rathayibacter soli]|uniref:FtsX-like permease family protein n=1 Tax=Rathayibacter soli TaxID=3144168 RepID=UPI0027E3E79C|nr:FtsX-like permease family protein [Glaciibacter superstes]
MALWLRRSIARRGLLAATAATCVVATFLLVSIVGFALQSERPAVRATIATGPVSSVGIRAETTLGTDASAQDAAARAVIAHELRGVDVHVYRSVATAPVTLALARTGASAPTASAPTASAPTASAPTTASPTTAILLEDAAAVRDQIHVIAGKWPVSAQPTTAQPTTAQPTTAQQATGQQGVQQQAAQQRGTARQAGAVAYPVAVQTSAAELLGLKIGDTVDIPSDNGALQLRVAATWRAADAADPLWFDDRQVVTGRSGAAVGPLIVAPDALGHLDATPAVRWVVTLDAAALTPAQLPQLVHGFGSLSGALGANSSVSSTIVTVTGDGGQTARGMTTSLASLGAVVSLPIAVLAVAVVLALILLARLLADTRESETTLLRARGATSARLLGAALSESGIVAAVGALVGVAGAAAVLAWRTGSLPSPAVLVTPPVLIVLSAVIVQLSVVGASVRGSLGLARDAGRIRSASSLGVTVLIVIAAAFALWRFLQFGDSSGTGGAIDTTGIIAPALALLAAVLVGLTVFAPLARRLENGVSGGSGVMLALPVRQVGRGLAFFVAPVALIILTIGTTTLAAGFVGTWSAYRSTAAQVVNAGELRVSIGTAAPMLGLDNAADTASYASLRGVTAAIPAIRASAVLGTGTAPVVAVPVAQLGEALTPDGGVIGADGIRSALAVSAPAMPGIALPRSSRSLSIAYSAAVASPVAPAVAPSIAPSDGDAPLRTVAVTVWLADADGTVLPIAYPTTPLSALSDAAATVQTKPVKLPTGGPWRAVAVDAAFSGGVAGDHYRWTLTGATAQDPGPMPVRVSDAHGWNVAPDAFSTDSAARGATMGIGLTVTNAAAPLGSTVRLMPGAAHRPSIVVTGALARANGLSVGDSVSLDGGWWAAAATVAKIVPVVPGEHSEAALFDLPTLQDALLRTTAAPAAANEIWIATKNPQQTLPAVSAVAGPSAVITLPDTSFVERFLGAATLALWLGCTGCVALAMIALAAATTALSRRRRPEVAVFRALGFSARQQRRSRGGELAVIATIAAVIGVATGTAVAFLVVPTLTQLAVVTAPAALPVQPAVDPLLLSVGYLVVIAAIAGVVLAYSGAVGRQAGDTEYREATL